MTLFSIFRKERISFWLIVVPIVPYPCQLTNTNQITLSSSEFLHLYIGMQVGVFPMIEKMF